MMKPPTSGPTIDDIPQTLLKTPCMRVRSVSVYISPMIVSASGINPPAPRPCRARKTISCGIDCEMPASIEPTRNSTIAGKIQPAAAVRSDNRPQSGTVAVDVRR